MITKAKRELMESRLIFETVMGMRPAKASQYAVRWRLLDKHPAYDAGVDQAFRRGAYLNAVKSKSLRPSRGTERAPIAPPHGTETPAPVPPLPGRRAHRRMSDGKSSPIPTYRGASSWSPRRTAVSM